MAMFDYAKMMGLSDLGPNETPYAVDEYAAALQMRDEGENQNMQPELHQNYDGQNPYAEGVHGAWLGEQMMGLMSGMGMLDAPTDPNAGLQLPIDEEDDYTDEDMDEMLGKSMELDEDSAEFQGLGGDDEEMG